MSRPPRGMYRPEPNPSGRESAAGPTIWSRPAGPATVRRVGRPYLAVPSGRIWAASREASVTQQGRAGTSAPDGQPVDRLREMSPARLRAMSSTELAALAGDVRDLLVTQTAKRGGHLGPNLGIVELTIALHLVF